MFVEQPKKFLGQFFENSDVGICFQTLKCSFDVVRDVYVIQIQSQVNAKAYGTFFDSLNTKYNLKWKLDNCEVFE